MHDSRRVATARRRLAAVIGHINLHHRHLEVRNASRVPFMPLAGAAMAGVAGEAAGKPELCWSGAPTAL